MDTIIDRLNQTDLESNAFFNALVKDVSCYLDDNVDIHYDIVDYVEFNESKFDYIYRNTFNALETYEGTQSVVERFTEMSEECDDPNDSVHELRRRLVAWMDYMVRA